MIDEMAAREYIMDMNKKGLSNLLLALNIESKLIDDSTRGIDINYSPLTSTLLVKCTNTHAKRLDNVLALIKRYMPTKPKSIVHTGKKEGSRAVRMVFEDDFNVIVKHVSEGELRGTV